MSKPEDIPQDVWDVAVNLASSLYLNTDDEGRAYIPSDEFPTVARTIMAAKAEEREACATIIQENMLCSDSHGVEVLLPRGGSGNEVGFAYAAAIRKRGEG